MKVANFALPCRKGNALILSTDVCKISRKAPVLLAHGFNLVTVNSFLFHLL